MCCYRGGFIVNGFHFVSVPKHGFPTMNTIRQEVETDRQGRP